MKRVDVVIYSVIKDILNGKFKSGIIYFDLKNNGVGFVLFMKGVLKSVSDKVNKVIVDIKVGKIKILIEVK